ncbi:MAG: hypothetical protein ACFFDY_01460 [Candidatus Thorarchaeota archaeon]
MEDAKIKICTLNVVNSCANCNNRAHIAAGCYISLCLYTQNCFYQETYKLTKYEGK